MEKKKKKKTQKMYRLLFKKNPLQQTYSVQYPFDSG